MTEALVVGIPAAVFFALALVRPAWGLAFFALARGAADAFSDVRLDALGAGVNPASALGAAALVAAAVRARLLDRAALRLCGPLGILLAVVGFEAAVGLATFGAGHAGDALRELLRFASILAFFALVLTLPSARERRIVYLAVLAAIAMCAAWGAVQYAAGSGTFEAVSGVRRARGPFAYPNTLAYAALLGTVLLGGELLSGAPGRAGRWGRIAGAAALLAVLALTASVTVIALAFLALGLFLLLTRRTALLAAAVVLALAACPLLLPRLSMLAASEPSVDLADGHARNTLTARLDIWRGLLSVARERPVWGWGLRSVPRVSPVQDEIRGAGSEPHNDFLLFLVEGGAVGLAGFIAFHLAALRMLARRAAAAPAGARKGRLAGLWVMYACMLAGSLGNNLLSFTALLVLFWGAAAACVRDETENQAQSKPIAYGL
ncbi:MAG TPA: hypothetical protein DCM87_16260 [Planctomycetes bacterium]|nr:hypothetical protein [Planctomycetota bacterium]